MSLLFAGTSHTKLVQALVNKHQFKLGQCQIKKFSCGETYVQLQEKVRDQSTFILQSTTQTVDTDIMEVCLLADALRRSNAKEINLIMPNFPYARQDRIAASGEPISAKVVADLLVASGITRLITFDLHSDQIEGFFDVPVDNIKCYSVFADYLKAKNLTDPVVVAPDASAAKIAQRLADLLNCEIAILNKIRPEHQQAKHTHLVGNVKNKQVILFDDMIDTAGSVCAALETVLKYGASSVLVTATHAVFSGPAEQRLNQAQFKEIIVTDTVPLSKFKLDNLIVLSIVDLLAKVV